MDKNILLSQRDSGINWFYWITGLSLINTVTNLMDSGYSFIVGLGYSQFIDAMMISLRDDNDRIMMTILLGCSLLISGFFALAGYLTEQDRRGWYLTAMILYIIDAFLYFYIGDYVGVGFHIFALYYIYRGYIAHRYLMQVDTRDSE